MKCSKETLRITSLALGALLLTIGEAGSQPWERHTIDNSSEGADGVRLADANGDGLVDIVTAWEEGGLTRVYLHPGYDAANTPWPFVTVGRVAAPEDAVFADLDLDGAIDVVTSCEGDLRTVFIHWAPTDPGEYASDDAWQTDAIASSRGRTQWMFCLPRDVDGDGDTDLVMGSKGENAGIGWFAGPENPRDVDAWTWQPLYDGGWIMSVQGHDIDSDGIEDILVSDRKGAKRGVLWLTQQNAGDPWGIERIGPIDEAEIMFLWGGRFAPDGPFHVITCSKRERLLFHFVQGTSGNSWEARSAEAPAEVGLPKAVAVGDLNQDGAQEIVLSCEDANDKLGLVALNFATFEFAWDIGGREGIKFDRIELVDLDGDGDRDVLTCEERAGLGVVWYENPHRNPR